ncbi:OsmC family protein [Nanchangia anserum]|uniref:OsmC family protein n=1 Tax=Nanchangia anserum TaxID=2692125 RepID=A0A8I0GDF5_9ACTO|nr:OsmC family protein [Nanchangia anserum]MBD3689508.1 OsmC family protein [Nanchangia anserum]QOX81697.1 OsmC family protein [Nanchangia anserum]
MSESSPLFLTRESLRLYTATNGEASVKVGDKSRYPGVFNPGELLQLALAGCAAMSADQTLTKVLGEDTAVWAGVDAEHDQDANKFTRIVVEVVAAMGALDEDARRDLIAKAEDAIARYCTVEHTVSGGDLDYRVRVVDETA